MDRYFRALGQVLGAAVILCIFFPKVGLAIVTFIVVCIIALSVDDYNIVAHIARRRRARILARRADAQDRALSHGNYRYGVYGIYPPPRI